MNPQLLIGGQPIYGHFINVSSTLDIPQADLSGQTSATDKADQGVKPKKLAVSLTVPFDNADWITTLVNLAEARDGKGETIPYIIVDKLAAALNIRQVTFVGTLSINESGQERAWDVSFSLSEHHSPAETAEKRLQSRSGDTSATSFREINQLIESQL